MDTAHDLEVDRNFDALTAILGDLLSKHAGEFALMRAGEVVEFFASETEAVSCGRQRYSDGMFSVQEITDRPADLGFFSHAIHTRIA